MFGGKKQRRDRGLQTAAAIDYLRKPNSGDRAASMVEYALLLLLVFLAALLTLQLFGESLIPIFDQGADAIEDAPGVNPP